MSSCPSTSGGIDGTGGVYFATVLCGGSYVGACYITTKGASSGAPAFDIAASNWAIEGWYVNTAANRRAFQGEGANGLIHHIAFINDISADNLQATDGNDNGKAGSYGVDYLATVGVIAQNSAQDSICLAAIDVVGPGVYDTKAGTHYFVYGNFAYANANSTCTSHSDTEDYMADTWNEHGVVTQGVFANNIGYRADRYCFEWTGTGISTQAPTLKLYNNTCFENNVNTGSDNLDGEITFGASGNLYATIIMQNNIAYQPLATSAGGRPVIAYLFAQTDAAGTFTNGGTGIQNFLRADRTACLGGGNATPWCN